VEVRNHVADIVRIYAGQCGREGAEAATGFEHQSDVVGRIVGAGVRHVVVHAPPRAVGQDRGRLAHERGHQLQHRIVVAPRGAFTTEMRGNRVAVAHDLCRVAEHLRVEALQHAPAAVVGDQESAIDQAAAERGESRVRTQSPGRRQFTARRRIGSGVSAHARDHSGVG
jgi:hypothetical protein